MFESLISPVFMTSSLFCYCTYICFLINQYLKLNIDYMYFMEMTVKVWQSKHWCNELKGIFVKWRSLYSTGIHSVHQGNGYLSFDTYIVYNKWIPQSNLVVPVICTSESSKRFDIFFSVVLIVISVCTAVGAWTWLWDSQTKQVLFY